MFQDFKMILFYAIKEMEEQNSAVYEGLTILSLALSLPHKYCDDPKEDARLKIYPEHKQKLTS